MNELMSLNVRKMQFYGALCLWRFGKKINFLPDSVMKLVNHLTLILCSTDLPKWEERGRFLRIAGRGDPLLDEVIKQAPENYLSDLSSLVEFSIEIGIVDMYGADTNAPSEFLSKSIDILNKRDIPLPDAKYLIDIKNNDGHWGGSISESEVKDLMKLYEKYI
jgi:hypothetical protein